MSKETCWKLIRDAAAGDVEARTSFTRRYLPVVRAYLAARWGRGPLAGEIDDAVQEVFLDCFQRGGALERTNSSTAGGFRAFLFGVVRMAALHFETRRAREHERRGDTTFRLEEAVADEDSLSRNFDREWARAVMREAADLQMERARAEGQGSMRRVELLRLRFEDGMPIRDIARLWNVEPEHLHHEYAKARKEFADALREVVGLHEGCSLAQLEEECRRLFELLD
jgi:RNA polymerase sigma factor (sigma-70 family)